MKWEYRLTELARIVGVPGHLPDKAFRSVSTDTRTLERGDVFFALLGERFDGGAFVPQAFEKGAVCAVTTRACDAGPCVVVDDRWRRFSSLALTIARVTTYRLSRLRGRAARRCPRILLPPSCRRAM
ncbi:MAG TPA: hypothetical protein ENN80_05680 [Candidatus Hydrogenedentes bacterium]|nr:hypothetical protein [Candidatus Hydrogenedentota bacterium]